MALTTTRAVVINELRDRIVAGLHTGRLRGGERLSSVRDLASQFEVNERVVLAALRALAEDGFIELRARSGAYIAPPHPSSGPRLPYLGTWLIATLLQARARGIAPRDVSEFIRRNTETRRVHAACIECNDDQLHLLCTELARDHGFVAESTPLGVLSSDDPPLSLRRADVLVTTAFHTDRVRRVANALAKPWIAVALRPDIMRGVAQHLRQGPVFYVATDPRFERKLRRMLAPFGPAANLRVLIVPRDDLDVIPAHAPTFVMTSARDFVRSRYGHGGGPGQSIHPPRHFSDDAARELLTFLVRLNSGAIADMT